MGLTLRPLRAGDEPAVAAILAGCGAFTADEVAIALEMVTDGLGGRYALIGVTESDRLCGYACIGPAVVTASAWYVYWICVGRADQGSGAALLLQSGVEDHVRRAGGDRLVVETSGRPDYARARRFYERSGFRTVGLIPDFYQPGDDCILYFKVLDGGGGADDEC